MTVPAEETPVPQTPPAEPEAPKSLRERQEAIVDRFTSEAEAVDDAAAANTPAAEGTQTADPAGSEANAEETPVPQPERIEVTPEQLADTKYWGGLDAEGWKRMERDYPVATKIVKAGQAASSRLVNEARKQTPPVQQREAEPSNDEPSAELLAAVEMSQSLDPKEAAKGHLRIAKLTASVVLKEGGVDPERNRASAIQSEAYSAAVAELPALATLNAVELDEVLDSTRYLKALVNVGTPEALAEAMIGAGQILIDRKTAAETSAAQQRKAAAVDLKKKETQAIVRSNANPASAAALNPHGASPNTMTKRERLESRFDTEVARQGGNRA